MSVMEYVWCERERNMSGTFEKNVDKTILRPTNHADLNFHVCYHHQNLVKRNQELSPSAEDQTKLLAQVTKISNVLDALVVSPDEQFEVQIEECRQVSMLHTDSLKVE